MWCFIWDVSPHSCCKVDLSVAIQNQNIQEILNKRRGEALGLMEEERQRHIKARTKPSRRIGPAGEDVEPAEACRWTDGVTGLQRG